MHHIVGPHSLFFNSNLFFEVTPFTRAFFSVLLYNRRLS